MTKTTAARLGLVAAVPLAAAVAGFGPLALFADQLPDRVATHYDGSGTPDGSMTVTQFALITGSLMAVGIAMSMATAWRSRRLPDPVPTGIGFLGGFLAGMGSGILGAEVVAQRGNTSWMDASSPGWVLGWALLMAIALGAIAARLAASLPSSEAHDHEAASVPVLALATGEHAVWTQTISSVLMLTIGMALIVAGAITFVWASRTIGVVLLVSAIPASTLAHVRVLADRTGLTLRYGPIGLPRQRIPLDRIELASTVEVHPTQWGGWGYRGSLLLMKRAALVLRGGPGLRLDLAGGKTFVVGVEHPEGAAALLNGERTRLS